MAAFHRGLILLAVLSGGALISWLVVSRPTGHARLPSPNDPLFQADGWSISSSQVSWGDAQTSTGGQLDMQMRRSDGASAQLVVWTNPQPQAKMLFRKGPERDFQGAGYSIESVPESQAPLVPGGGALVARQGNSAWLLLYTYGERRGRLGNGATAWALAEWDGLWDVPNDYYLARVGVSFAPDRDPLPLQTARQIADSVFPRLAAWYSDQGSQSG